MIESAIVDPELSGIVICGAAGVGKSRIAREALAAAESKGCDTRWAVGTSSARKLPAGAFAAWAEPTVADTLELVRGIIQRLTSAPSGATAVIGIDDVPLLDDLSTFVVQQIVQRGAAKLVLTVRDGDPVPAGTQEIWRIGQFDRIDLQPLSHHEVATLLAATLGGSVDADAAQRLWALTRGNVLYLRNIVEREVADGRLAQQHGYWRWTGDPVVPPGLLEMVESRIGALPTSVSDVIDALAVSEPIELVSLAGITTAAALEFDAAHLRFVIADGHVGALLQSGRATEAWDLAEQLQEQAAELDGGAKPYSDGVAGRAALGIGRLDVACALMDSVVGSLSASGEAVGWRYRYQIPYSIALAMRGATDEAAATLADLATRRHPSWQCLDYERDLARAWVAAAQGALSEAITAALSGAETARANGQFAAEVLCLQTATQFGDRSAAPRLQELATVVEGPRVGLAARFADALHTDDAAELAAVSEEFEQIGYRVAALDAAAHAAMAYRRQNLRGSAYGCAARAQTLAEQCGGANTPALREVVEPLPLSAREREIVMLIGAGLSNRAVAERLTVSVRTVEGHIYQAMKKTGAASRDELITMLPQHKHAPHRAGTFE